MIHVIASIQIQPGKRDAFLAEFHRLMPEVHAEAGCLAYGPTVDIRSSGIDRQAPVRDDVVTIVEQWESLDALKAHLAAPHMAAYRERVKEMVSGATLHILEPA